MTTLNSSSTSEVSLVYQVEVLAEVLETKEKKVHQLAGLKKTNQSIIYLYPMQTVSAFR